MAGLAVALHRPRDVTLEHQLTRTACEAAGLPPHVATSLRAYADSRAWSGPVRLNVDWDLEAFEEIGDAANYLAWGLTEDHDGYMDGHPEATARFERRMRALMRCVQMFSDLLTDAH